MYTYSIMPLTEQHFDEICADVREQYERGISTCPLFKMTLVPEGDPVWDKAGPMCALYRRYREALAPYGIRTGVLVQASLGHSYEIKLNPFDRYINLTDGQPQFVCCPEDERFLEHFSHVLEQIAAEHPDAIMLDDDFRLVNRGGRGCACPRHMAEFHRRTGTQLTREELLAHIREHGERDPLTRAFQEVQRDSLIKAATRFRAAIDRIDPTIQGINCTSGDACESVAYTSRIFAGRGNPSIVRVANGTYAPLSTRGFSKTMRNTAVRAAKLRAHGVDVILSETDTVPFNRYAKSARYLHAHYAASLLEGLCGAKHWITRLSAYEPQSGRAFREILATHAGMYQRLSELAKGLQWVGCGLLFTELEFPSISAETASVNRENNWDSLVLERMGLPFYYTSVNHGAVLLEGGIVEDLDNATIQELFEGGSVFAAAQPAHALCERGFGDRLGVAVTPWPAERITGECFDGDTTAYCTKQKEPWRLEPTDARTKVLSQNFANEHGGPRMQFPGVTCLERDPGRLSVVFCGTPKANFHYTEGFAFLNESRKRQLIGLWKRAGVLPVYYEGDNELCLRAARLEDGRLLVFALILSFDPEETLSLYLETPPTVIEQMLPDGTTAPMSFTDAGHSLYTVHTRTEPMYPTILLIQ